MKFVYVTNKNFEEIFAVSAKYEQWEYVKHHIFDMADNYVAVVNERYLPIPFLVYESDTLIGFVQINYDEKKSLYEICKLIVHETEQGRGYGAKILSEVRKWICTRSGQGTITASYKASNSAADQLFSNAGFSRTTAGDQVTAAVAIQGSETEPPESEFENPPYAALAAFVNQIKGLKKYPENSIGDEEEIHFEKINTEKCEEIIEMKLLESQEDYVMPFVDSLAESFSDLFEEEITVSYALCNGSKPVGLVEIRYMAGEEFPGLKEKPVYDLFRILVDKKYQKNGYGTRAVQVFLDYVKKRPLGDADDIVVSVVEGNDVALKLYQRFGFEIFGRDRYGHIALRKNLDDRKIALGGNGWVWGR